MPEIERLVVLGSAINALALVRCGHRLGLDTVVVDTKPGLACSSRWATVVIIDEADLDRILLLARDKPSALIATSDVWLQFLSRHRERLNAAFGAILQPRTDIIDICLRKSRFARWCHENDVPTPPQWHVGDAAEPIFPLIIRPDATRHDDDDEVPKAVHVESREQLDRWLDAFRVMRVEAVVTQSLLHQPLRQFSVPFARWKGTTLMFVAEKLRPEPEQCSVGSYVEACTRPDIEAIARRAVDRLGYEGIGEVEILYDGDLAKGYVIEINPRPWTQYSLSRALGFDFLGHALGRSPHMPLPRRAAIGWIDFRSDLFTVLSRRSGMLRHGKLSWAQYLRSFWRARAFAKFDVTDPLPFFVDVSSFVRSLLARRDVKSGAENVDGDIRTKDTSTG